MLWEDAMSKQQKPESSGNELRNHIREQCFSCSNFLLQASHLLNPFESNGTLCNQQSCFELKTQCGIDRYVPMLPHAGVC